MFYVRIAIAVAVWVSIWNLSIKEKKKFFDKFFDKLLERFRKLWKWFKKVGWICWNILIWLLKLSVAGICIYKLFLFIKIIDWGRVWEIAFYLLLYCSPAIAFVLLVLLGSWLDKKRQNRKNRMNDKKRQEEQIERNLESLDLWEYEIKEEDITEEDINKK